MQLKAGYFTSGIETLRSSDTMAYKVDSLMENLSYFDLDTNMELADTCDDPAVALMYNIVSRGTPTYASQFVEDILSTTIGKTLKRISDNGTIYRDIQKQEVRDMVFRALHVVDPRVKPQLPKNGGAKAREAYRFLLEGAVPAVGDYIWQLAETKRSFSNMFRFSRRLRRELDALKADPNFEFLSQECDLSFHAPYSTNTADDVVYQFNADRNGIDTTDYITEEQISALLQSINVQGRVIVRDSQNPYDRTEELTNFTMCEYFDMIRQNYESPLYNTEDGIEALQLALTPLAIARVQKVVLEAVNSGTLSLEAKSWHICVIERDVPCAFLAIEDLRQHFNRFFTLENRGRKFPQVKLEIFHTQEFESTELNLLYQGSRDDISEFNPLRRYDLLIDISVLRRAGFDPEVPPTITDRYAVIRSSKSPSADTRLLFCDYISYDIEQAPKHQPVDEDSEAEADADADADADDSDNDCYTEQAPKHQPDDEDPDAEADADADADDSDNDCYTEQEDAMRFFLKNLFAKNDFMEGQIESIRQLLNGNNLLHVSGPATGKTLIMLFAALMKPGYSFVLPPTIAVMESQFNTLRGRRIDSCFYISPVLQNSYNRTMAVKEVVDGHSLVTLISPSLVHDPYIRNVFAGINQRNIPIYFIMLDEAQRISLQTSEYRAYYQDIRNIIAGNFDADNTQMLRIGAFTSTMEGNVQKEIAEKLCTDATVLLSDTFASLTSLPVAIHEVDLRGLGNTDDLAAYSLKLKRQELETMLAPVMRKHQNSKALILSTTPPYDSVDVYGESNRVCDMDTAHYLGDIDEAYNPVSSSVAYRSMKELDRFCSNANTRILAATYTAGLGMHASGLKRIIHIEPPLSLDQFCRANGRGMKGDNVQVDLYMNTVPTKFLDLDTNFDTAANLRRLGLLTPGAGKEKTVIAGLLDGVVFPIRTDRNNIIDAVYNEFGVEIDTDTEPMVHPYQLYIYSKGREKSYGHIDFRTRKLHMPEMQYDQPLAEKLQKYIYDVIADNTADPLAYLETMETEFPSEENDGIQTAIDAILEGRKATVQIPFYNNAFQEAAHLLSSNLEADVDHTTVQRCYNRTRSLEDFERMLANDYGIRPKNLEETKRRQLAAMYGKFRNKRDTLLAVSRMKEIDIIDDYLVNAATGIVTVSLTKHNKDFYRMKLMPILQRNLTRERMLSYISAIEEEKFLKMESYTNVLIDFFYNEIYPLYEKSAMDTSKFFATVLQKQKEGTISTKQIAENLDSYFKSRFKCKFVYDGDDTLAENPQNVDKIVGIIDRVGSNINQLMNLQASIDLSVPENRTPANKIIYGFCDLFTSRDAGAQSRFNAYSHISEGLLDFRRKHSTQEFNEELESITNKITSENFDLKDEAGEVMAIQMQSQWLRWFNSQVLKIQNS
ncbi:MAG: hypothetical protein MJZ66_08170 [Bacteroidales bacterium]|nr:hypothetical protein [Bacteroidales bacterium]